MGVKQTKYVVRKDLIWALFLILPMFAVTQNGGTTSTGPIIATAFPVDQLSGRVDGAYVEFPEHHGLTRVIPK
jgi:uncharacterized membrane protein